MPSSVEDRLKRLRRKTEARKARLLDGVRTTGNTELDDAAEREIIEREFRSESVLREQQKRLEHLTGKVHYFVVQFPSEPVCEEFLKKSGFGEAFDAELGVVDGMKLAQMLGIALSPAKIPFREVQPDRRLVEEVGVIE